MALNAHDSDIIVSSELGKGTSFTFELPIYEVEKAEVSLVNGRDDVVKFSEEEKQILQPKILKLRSFKLHQAFEIEQIGVFV